MQLLRIPQHAPGLLSYSQASAEELTVKLNDASASITFENLEEGELWTEELTLKLPIQPLIRATRHEGEVWVECLAWYQGDSDSEAFPENPPFPWQPPQVSLQAAKTMVRGQVKAYAGNLRDRFLGGNVSPGEMAAWPLKEAEANAHLANQNAETPVLSLEAQVRGVSLDKIVQLVIENSMQFKQLESIIAGTRGRHDDAIESLTTVEEVLAYNWQEGWIEPPGE